MGINTKLILDIVENSETEKPVRKVMVESRAKPNQTDTMVEGKDKEVEAIKKEATKLAKKLGGEVEGSGKGNAFWGIRFPEEIAFKKQKNGNTNEHEFYMTTNEMQYKGKWKEWFDADEKRRDIKKVEEPNSGDVVFYFQGIDP